MTSATQISSNGWWQSLQHGRDLLLCSPRFRQWAAAFPLTRSIARRRARETFDLVAGFVYSQILFSCIRLNLFEILAEGPQSPITLSSRMSLPIASSQRLLDASVALNLVEKRGIEKYGLGRLGTAFVNNPAIHAMIEHHALLYADLRDPVELLRGNAQGTALSAYWPYVESERPADLPENEVSAYTGLMSASQPLISDEVLDAYSLLPHRCLLDVGGGDGTFLLACGKRYPKLDLMLFDLPAVADIASRKFDQAGMAQRATAFGGDFLADNLPKGADIISFVRVIHDHPDANVLAMLRAAYRALNVGGTLLIAEPIAGTASARSVGDAYFAFYLMAMGSGHPRTAKRLGQLVEMAGFGPLRSIPTRLPLQTSLFIALPKNC